jgi:hypothetical protein
MAATLQDLLEEVGPINHRHDGNVPGRNVINNLGFAILRDGNTEEKVEVVRRGPKNTRIRKTFLENAEPILVKSELLTEYVHLKS